MSRRTLTFAERLAHPWWGITCPSCGAEPGEVCGYDGVHEQIHGQRSAADASAWVDPRRGEPEVQSVKLASRLRVAHWATRRGLIDAMSRPAASTAAEPQQLALWGGP